MLERLFNLAFCAWLNIARDFGKGMAKPLFLSRLGRLFPGSKAEKPVLVIIGEVHLPAIEESMMQAEKLKVRVKEAHGVKRYAADIKTGGKETRESIRRLVEGIIKKETLVLKDENISRLFLEEPASKGRINAYSGYRQAHDIKSLKGALRAEIAKENARSFVLAKKYLHDSGIPKPLFEACMNYHENLENGSAFPVFDLPQVNIAHKAGVFDIHPDEDEQEFMEVTYLFEARALLLGALNYLGMAWVPVQEVLGKRQAEALEELGRMREEATRVLGIINKRIGSLSRLREKNVCKTVSDGYVPGSAVICGMRHVGPLERELSKRFEVKVYKVGESFLGAAR